MEDLSGGIPETFLPLFTVYLIHISHSTASKSAGVVYTTKSTPWKYPLEEASHSNLQINWNLLHCLWAILQLDQCIMSWHGPSLCADSSVSLGDPETFISQSQPASSPQPLLSLFPEPEMVSVRSGLKGKKWSANRFLIPYRGACGSSKALNTSSTWMTWIWGDSFCLTIIPLYFYSNCSYSKQLKQHWAEWVRKTPILFKKMSAEELETRLFVMS